MKVAYIRVSTAEQNEARQIEAMKNIGIERFFAEKVSAKNVKDREQLKRMLDFVREGDEVYISDFSRLSRSVQDLLKIVELLKEKGVRLISLKESLDSDTATGKLMLTMIGAIAEFERQNMLDRQREGIEIAKALHKYHGRGKIQLDNWDEIYEQWRAKKITATEAHKILGISRGTFYNRVHQQLERERKNTIESNDKGHEESGREVPSITEEGEMARILTQIEEEMTEEIIKEGELVNETDYLLRKSAADLRSEKMLVDFKEMNDDTDE